MAGTQIDITGVKAVTAQTEERVTTIKRTLTNMESRISALSEFWQGEAASGYHKKMTRWHEDAKTLQRTMETIVDMLHTTARKYQEQDQV